MALLDLQGMETTAGGGGDSDVSLLLCHHSDYSLTLCNP